MLHLNKIKGVADTPSFVLTFQTLMPCLALVASPQMKSQLVFTEGSQPGMDPMCQGQLTVRMYGDGV